MTDQTSRRMLLGMIAATVATLPATRVLGASRIITPHILDLPVAGGRISQVTHWRALRRRGTIVFSHGALSSPAKYDPLILPWVAAGYDVWAPLHVDSTDHPDTKLFPALMSWRARIEDMRALTHHLGTRPRIAAGHSYGALVALTLGGASSVVPEGLSGPLRDPLTKAVLAFSPPGAAPGLVDGTGYASLSVPALIQTGNQDNPPAPPDVPPNPDAWRGHLLAYDSATVGGDRYALVLDGVDHYFGGLICRPELPGPKQTPQMERAVALSRLFLDAYGRGDERSRHALDARLTENGPAQLRRK